MTRPAILPRGDRPPFWRCAFRWCVTGVVFAMLAAFMLPGCNPRAFKSVNKLAPEPPYAGERHKGMDRAEYLRDEEPLDAD